MRRTVLASLLCVLLLSAWFEVALANSPGGWTGTISRDPSVLSQEKAAHAQKLLRVQKVAPYWATTGSLNTPVIGQGQVWNVDPFYSNPPDYIGYTNLDTGNPETCLNPTVKPPNPPNPCPQPPRYCVHCGTTSALIAITYMASIGRFTNDLSQLSVPTQILKLGNGYYNGNNSSYAINVCCDSSPWAISPFTNLHPKERDNLNVRLGSTWYVVGSTTSQDNLHTEVAYDVTYQYPLIAGLHTKPLTYYVSGDPDYKHVLVVDGYDDSVGTYTVNDPNDCTASAQKYLYLGHHAVTQSALYNAISGGANVVVW